MLEKFLDPEFDTKYADEIKQVSSCTDSVLPTSWLICRCSVSQKAEDAKKWIQQGMKDDAKAKQ